MLLGLHHQGTCCINKIGDKKTVNTWPHQKSQERIQLQLAFNFQFYINLQIGMLLYIQSVWFDTKPYKRRVCDLSSSR